MSKLTRTAVNLGAIAGVLCIAPVAQAEIPISGGNMNGNAAFFVPGSGETLENTTLFDMSINGLVIETPNGTTNTAIFIPSAGRLDPIGNRLPQTGDTGTLQGGLTGIAFSSQGMPVFFSDAATTIDFTLSSDFTPALLAGGTLVSPVEAGSANLIFLPFRNVTLSESSAENFSTSEGNLALGAYDADLTGQGIDLPDSLKFQTFGTGTPQPPTIGSGQRIKFELKGEGPAVETASSTDDSSTDTTASTSTTSSTTSTTSTTPSTTTASTDPATSTESELETDLIPDEEGNIAFRSEDATVDKFKLQTVGRSGQRFKIDGEFEGATVDIEITGIDGFKIENLDAYDPTGMTRFDVKGEGIGITSILGADGVYGATFDSNDAEIRNFKFDQEGGFKLQHQGKTEGGIALEVVGSGLDTTNLDLSNVSSSSTDYGSLSFGNSINFSGQDVFLQIQELQQSISVTSAPASFTLITLNGELVVAPASGYVSVVNLVVPVTVGEYTLNTFSVPARGRVKLSYKYKHGKGLALGQRNRSVVAYQLTGPSSRIFPGLVGMQELSEAELDALSEDLDIDAAELEGAVEGLAELPADDTEASDDTDSSDDTEASDDAETDDDSDDSDDDTEDDAS